MKPFRLTIEGRSAENEPYMDEYAFLTDHKELIVGDTAVGTVDNRLLIAPEWFPITGETYPPAHNTFRKVVAESGATSLLTSHGSNIFALTLAEVIAISTVRGTVIIRLSAITAERNCSAS